MISQISPEQLESLKNAEELHPLILRSLGLKQMDIAILMGCDIRTLSYYASKKVTPPKSKRILAAIHFRDLIQKQKVVDFYYISQYST